MIKDTKTILTYDEWVITGLKFLPQTNYQSSFYDLLCKLNPHNPPNNSLYLLTYTINLDSNIRKSVTRYADKPNLNKLIEEIRDAILLNNFNSLFYSNLILTENIVDLIISNNLEIKIPPNQYEEVYNLLCNYKYSWVKKKEFINKAVPNSERTREFKLFLRFLEVIYLIRNRFMFHLNNYEYYSKFYPHISEKEELLIKPLKTIVKVIKDGKSDFKQIDEINSIANKCKRDLKKIIDKLEKNKSSEEVLLVHHLFYSKFPEIFTEFSCIIIILWGRLKINIFNDIPNILENLK